MRIVLLTLMLAAGSVTADEGWQLTTGDFAQQSIRLRAIDAQTVGFINSAGEDKTIPLEQFLRIEREARSAPAAAGGRYTLFLVTGDRIGGEPGVIAEDVINWTSPAFGDLKLPIDKVRGISREPNPAGLDDDRKEDQVVLTNRDISRGVVAAMADGKVSLQMNGNTSLVPLASVVSIFFVSAAHPATPNAKAMRIQFTDGSIVTTPSLTADAGKLKLKVAGDTERSVNLSTVAGIEQLNGPIAWLSTLKPTVNEQVSFISETPLPARMDKNVFGKPIRFGTRTYERGIGVHANSKVEFALDSSFKAFRTCYAIDATRDASIANVTVRVLVDGKLVHEDKNFRANRMSPMLVFPLEGAKTLTLEVTANETIDAQDRLNWIEAALLRTMPQKSANP